MTPAFGPGTEVDSDLPTDRPSPCGQPLPARFGRYLLVEQLGGGGMADVYRAIAPGAAGVSKEVCIKRIRGERLDDPRLVSLFIDEARVSMQLSHVNIVHTYDFGRVGDEYFLALEFVDGVDLATVLDTGGPLGPDEVAAVGEALCRALHHVHSRKRADGTPLRLVHRDVTPRNVLVTVEGDVKLADFGVARLRSGRSEGLRGTLAYMAPEQANSDAVDATSDLFAVGLVLYECLHGEPAYRGSHDDVLDLARRGAVDVDAGASELEAVIARAVALDRARRFADAASMAEDLGRLVARARAAGAADPRGTLAARAASKGPTRLAGHPPDAPEDRRPAAYYTEDGGAPDFAARLGATELSQAATVAGGVSRHLGFRSASLLVLLALVVGAVGTALLRGPDTEPPESRAPTEPARRPRASPPEIAGAQEPRVAAAPPRATAPRDSSVPERSVPGPVARAASSAVRRTGTLDLNALPWAEALIDGVPRGTTPVAGLRLLAGRHRIRLENPAMGVTRWIVVSIEPDEHRTVVIDLQSRDDGTRLAPRHGSSP